MTRILVTGGGGFIASHLVDRILADTDWEVVVLDRLDRAGNLGRLLAAQAWNPGRLRVCWHDLRAALSPSVTRELRRNGPWFDYIAHLAAGSHVDRSIKDPVGFLMDNVIGTAHLLDWARENAAQTLIFSTDEVFGAADEGDCFDEAARFNPTNPYAASKAGSELLAPAYANSYGMKIQVTRCANVFGEWQDEEKFIPIAIRKIRAGVAVPIHVRLSKPAKDPRVYCDCIVASRMYTYHRNVTGAVLKVLTDGECVDPQRASSGRYNIEGGEEVDNERVCGLIADYLGVGWQAHYIENPPDRPRPDMRYAIDSSKLRALGWAPEVSFEEGLRRTVEAEVERVAAE